jgi:hypothetical protein
MASYQEIVINRLVEDKMEKRAPPRARDNLPVSIKGTGATWYQPEPSATQKVKPPSYHLEQDLIFYPIEFINQKWHFLNWDDSKKFHGYWVHPDKVIKPGNFGLGSFEATLETQILTVGPSTYRERDRAESHSTQPDKEEEDSPSEADPMDTNPKRTEELANTFSDNPIFLDVAEEIDAPGDRTHYLPTIVPPITTLRPVGVNPPPLRVRTTREETIGATTDSTKLITNAIKLDGSLKGKVPDAFNGDRTKTQKFLNAFSLFWMNNEDNSHMKNPYKRSTYFLGLFSGEKVDDWVQDQTLQLQKKTTRLIS